MLNELFHPKIAAWFKFRFKKTTEVQSLSWPEIAKGHNLLITAPTGSGKTLTAFLWAINQFVCSKLETGTTRVLYISPLKALNNDIYRNLVDPLGEIRQQFENSGKPMIEIRVQIRSGDTPQSTRQKMLRRPPEILITTPESLNLMLTNPRGRLALSGVKTVIFDEIHSIADNRRGVQLMLCAERLAHITGGFQRIALSATVRPLDKIAAFVGGQHEDGTPRPVKIIVSLAEKKLEMQVAFPEEAKAARNQGIKIWEPLTESFLEHIRNNTSTLFFTNNRALAENITLKINANEEFPLAYAHHGSLAREIRTLVEERLKAGELKAIVATNSLEMGIDIGALDEVILIQSPPSIASTLQRIGRAGHGVGETSRGTLYPTHPQDFVEAAALTRAVLERDIEPIKPLQNALDVLAQTVVSMTATETWDKDELYRLIKRSFSYQTLDIEVFDLVIEMLAGRYQQSRIRNLKPRLQFDRLDNSLNANKAALFALYNSGGTIPDRGYYKLRHAETGALIGELDEEFVWEARVGQNFALGTQHWRINRITHNDVLVHPSASKSTPAPFWKAEGLNRNSHLSLLIGKFLYESNQKLQQRGGDKHLHEQLVLSHCFDENAATELTDYLLAQREFTGADLPNRNHLLLEHIKTGPGGYQGPDHEQQLVFHTLWGGTLNQPFALALSAAYEQYFGIHPDIHADNNAVVIQVKQTIDPDLCLSLVTPENLEVLLRESLENSGFFGARFRECSARALLLTRQKFNQRLPLWMSRVQAKNLMDTVKDYPDFPILLETWRTCLQDEFDLAQLKIMLGEIRNGEISYTQISTDRPSPFAANISWNQINSQYMYADDTPHTPGVSALTDELLRSAAFGQATQIKISDSTIQEFETKRQRLWPGYAPQSLIDLEEWVKERICIPEAEWSKLCSELSEELSAEIQNSSRLAWITVEKRRWCTHLENQEIINRLWLSSETQNIETPTQPGILKDTRSAAELLIEFLVFYGPRSITQLSRLLPINGKTITVLISGYIDDGTLVSGFWNTAKNDTELQFCDAQNFDSLLRFQRNTSRHASFSIPFNKATPFFAHWQNFGALPENLSDTMEKLSGVKASVDTWLNCILPCRHPAFSLHQLDTLISNEELVWVGADKQQLTLVWQHELDLIRDSRLERQNEQKQEREQSSKRNKGNLELVELFTDPTAQYSYNQLLDRSKLGAESFNTLFWNEIWQGQLTSNGITAIDKALSMKFKLSSSAGDKVTNIQPSGGRRRHASGHLHARRIRGLTQGWPGLWKLVDTSTVQEDALTRMEQDKERVRLLLDRYGIVCREIINQESSAFTWSGLFRCMRLMELSGELIGGLFIEGFSGPQFTTESALRKLSSEFNPGDFWISALDPISPCGLRLQDKQVEGASVLPQRRRGNFLVYGGGKLVLVAEKNASKLTFYVSENDPKLEGCYLFLQHLLNTRGRIPLEEINGQRPTKSPLLDGLIRRFESTRDHKDFTLLNRM